MCLLQTCKMQVFRLNCIAVFGGIQLTIVLCHVLSVSLYQSSKVILCVMSYLFNFCQSSKVILSLTSYLFNLCQSSKVLLSLTSYLFNLCESSKVQVYVKCMCKCLNFSVTIHNSWQTNSATWIKFCKIANPHLIICKPLYYSLHRSTPRRVHLSSSFNPVE